MAMMACKECKHQVSTTAPTCPNCGAKVAGKQTTSGCAWVAALVIGGFFAMILYIMGGMNELNAERAAAEARQAQAEKQRIAALSPEEQAAVAAKKAEEEAVRLGLRWIYSESDDAMGRGKVKLAMVQSTNEIEFDFPYKGPQRATLGLRQNPGQGPDVMFSIKRGQFQCSFRGCKVQVRFGDGKPVSFSASEPSDNSSTTLFILDEATFIKRAKQVDTIAIEAEFFQQGMQVLQFHVADLKWP